LDLFSTLKNKNKNKKSSKTSSHDSLVWLYQITKLLAHSCNAMNLAPGWRNLLYSAFLINGSLLSYNVEEFYVFLWCSWFQPGEEI
jgi:hypothetical protein